MPGIGDLVAGAHAVVVPVDPDRDVRVIDWPGQDSLSTLRREIDCRMLSICDIGGLGFWHDDQGALGEGWTANGRAAWLGQQARRHGEGGPILPGTVLVTLHDTDRDGDTLGLARELADRIARIARHAPPVDVEEMNARLAAEIDRGPVVFTLDEHGMPDGVVF